jgi:polar amino acid transport system ATP-binding protein
MAYLAPLPSTRERRLVAGPSLLRVEGVTKYFGPRIVLNGVSLNLPARNVLALCGASGAGKTTLLRIISGLCGFNSGKLLIELSQITATNPYPRHLYGRIGFVSQNLSLFPHLTSIDNVALALRDYKRLSRVAARARALIELERLGVASLAAQYPATLSGGESQRVAIARALALDPLVLLLDEPTAHLDPERVDDFCRRIDELRSNGTSMLVVTHNLRFARRIADYFAIMNNGVCCCSNDAAILETAK